MKIIKAQEEHMEIVRGMFLKYQAWVDNDICFKGFEEEIANLPGQYSPPKGAIFLGYDDTDVVACAAIRPRIDKSETEAELKRIFVKDNYREHGLGKEIFDFAMQGAKEIGYKTVVIETLPKMIAAQHLYEDYGFERATAYFENADEGVDFFRYTFDNNG